MKFIYIFAISILSTSCLLAENKIPDREQRIYSLSKIWKELEYNFAFPEKLQSANLDSLYLVYLPKIEKAQSNFEYYRLLSSFMAHFNEAHTRIYSSNRIEDVPPLKVTNFGEKIIINDVSKNQADHIPIGSEVLKIDHIPVLEYIKDSISPYISASTSQWKFDKSVLELFSGKPESVVHITIKTPKGKIKEAEMIRNYYTNDSREILMNNAQFSPIEIKILDGDIGYIKLNSFLGGYTDTINQVFNNNLPRLRKCRGLIIDIRGNRGGSDRAWENITFHLVPEMKFHLPVTFFSRIHNACYKNWGTNSEHPQLQEYYKGIAMTEVEHAMYTNELDDSVKLHQPLVVLSGQHVASAAEDFLLLMKSLKQAVIIGEPSVGCVGEPTFVPLSDGFEAMICVKRFVCLDGTQPNDKGIMPDIFVQRDYESYLKGKDNLIIEGIKELRMRIKK